MGPENGVEPGASPAAHPPRPARPAPPVIAGYQLLRLLGRGGTATVFEALNETGDRVAIKYYERGFAVNPRWQASGQELRNCPNLLVPLGVEQLDDRVLCVFPLVKGEDLAEARKGRAFTAHSATEILVAIAEAIGCLHRYGWIHGDLNPRNLYLEERGPVLADLPIATPGPGEWLVTRRYSAPEVLLSASHMSPAADIYSLAVVVGETLTGSADPDRIQEALIKGSPTLAPLARLLRDMSNSDPDSRPSADDVQREALALMEVQEQAWRLPVPSVKGTASTSDTVIRILEAPTENVPLAPWLKRRDQRRAVALSTTTALMSVVFGLTAFAIEGVQAAESLRSSLPELIIGIASILLVVLLAAFASIRFRSRRGLRRRALVVKAALLERYTNALGASHLNPDGDSRLAWGHVFLTVREKVARPDQGIASTSRTDGP